ncbi:MAG: hypothetical protein GXZ11_08440 [Tissierellia bacterium]|nr:hypothetical protein [Tissierellia bacterium]
MQNWLKEMEKTWMELKNSINNRGYAISSFKNPRECQFLKSRADMHNLEYDLWPGDSWERNIVLLSEPGDCNYFSGKALKLIGDLDGVKHNDILGSIMHLGLDRGEIGDIVKIKEHYLLFTSDRAAKIIKNNLREIGSTIIKVDEWGPDLPTTPEIPGMDIVISVASLRLDNVLREVYGLKRAEAQQFIERNQVKVNYLVESRTSYIIEPGDLISLSRAGRARVKDIEGYSKKGRCRISVFVYEHGKRHS